MCFIRAIIADISVFCLHKNLFSSNFSRRRTDEITAIRWRDWGEFPKLSERRKDREVIKSIPSIHIKLSKLYQFKKGCNTSFYFISDTCGFRNIWRNVIKLYVHYRVVRFSQDISMLCLGTVILRYKSPQLICAKDDRFKVNQLFNFLLRQREFPWWLSTSSPTNLTNSPSIKLMVWTFQRLLNTLTGRHFVNFATNSTSIWLHILTLLKQYR